MSWLRRTAPLTQSEVMALFDNHPAAARRWVAYSTVIHDIGPRKANQRIREMADRWTDEVVQWEALEREQRDAGVPEHLIADWKACL